MQLVIFTDALFANNKDLSSQIGYILVLADAIDKINIVHWSSIKYKRVTRSILVLKLYEIAHSFDIAAAVKSILDKVLRTNILLVFYTNSRSLYQCLVKLGTTQEKRLIIDVLYLRQAYERREIAEVRWIKRDSNPADAMTKSKTTNVL